MAGTSWDKLGQMDAAFELVAPPIRRVAADTGARLHEFFRDDPVWRLDFARTRQGDPAVDVSWSEETPDRYEVSAVWWEGETVKRVVAGGFGREQSLDDLETLLRQAVASLPE